MSARSGRGYRRVIAATVAGFVMLTLAGCSLDNGRAAIRLAGAGASVDSPPGLLVG